MKIHTVFIGILVALFVLLISSSLAAEDEILSESKIRPNPYEIMNLEHDRFSGRGISRSKRQIPFISNWLYPRDSKSKSGGKKSGSSNSSKYVSGPNGTTLVDRDGRFLNLFTVVRFENTECLSASGDNGTCYPNAECTRRGGAANGKCAEGYGVCCVFMRSCGGEVCQNQFNLVQECALCLAADHGCLFLGQTWCDVSKSCGASTNQNCTYFTHNGYPSSFDGTGSCQLTVYKCTPDICQYKLEFDSFNIAQPGPNGICNNDQFIISGTTTAVPIICGVNTGNHMYIDVGLDNSPVTLSVITSGPTFSRSWKIKVTQVRCNTPSKAPEGCLQYHQGVSGVVRTYNFDFTSGQQISNQDYSTCIRMERNFCGIRYTACTDSGFNNNPQTQRSRAFSLTGQQTAQTGALVGAQNCQTDWITIPCATNSGRTQQTGGTICQDRLCGDTFNSETSQIAVPVFSYAKPFRITYHSDSNETNDSGNRGFCLNFIQQPCTPQQ